MVDGSAERTCKFKRVSCHGISQSISQRNGSRPGFYIFVGKSYI